MRRIASAIVGFISTRAQAIIAFGAVSLVGVGIGMVNIPAAMVVVGTIILAETLGIIGMKLGR